LQKKNDYVSYTVASNTNVNDNLKYILDNFNKLKKENEELYTTINN
jgi:hypothetical protein